MIDNDELRKQAEEIARKKAAQSPENLAALSPEETRQTLHKLRVHQIELEIQNEELHRAQAELEDARARYFDLYDQAPVGYVTVSEKGLILEANLTAATLLGTARSALVKKPISRFILKEDQDIYYLHRKQLFETHSALRLGSVQASSGQAGEPQSRPWKRARAACELRMVKKDGTIFWARLEANVAPDPSTNSGQAVDGAPVSRVVLTDITERKRAEEELRESEEKYHRLIENLNEGVWHIDKDAYTTFVNPHMAKMLGYAVDEMLGKHLFEFMDEHGVEIAKHNLDRRQKGIKEHHDFEFIRKDGNRIYAILQAAPIIDKNDHYLGSVAGVLDITERKRAEDKLRGVLAELERSNKDLELFASIASHDLQEPLRMVAGYTQLLAERYEGQLDEKAKKYIAYAVEGAIRMQQLVNDLLTYSRVGTRGNPIETKDSHSILGEAIGNLAALLEESKAIVTNEELPMVRVDASQLVQLFQNLLANAIKFRAEDFPRIHVSARDEGREWVFSVRDNGIGIDRKYADRIFVIFQRLHTRQEYPGTGIGLAVCKRIVERHGGKIWFESEPGKGSIFFFTVPK